MSAFRDCLERICADLDGVMIATIMGNDGIAVETFVSDALPEDLEADAVLVEYASVLGRLGQLSSEADVGAIEEVCIRSSRLQTIFRALTPDYFVALALGPDASAGRGRFLLRTRTQGLLKELTP